MKINGWQVLDDKTSVFLRDGRVIKISSSRKNLDSAIDAAEQFNGQPFTRVGEWFDSSHSEYCECSVFHD